jgi:2-dehydro-3-deoxygalactonokinase
MSNYITIDGGTTNTRLRLVKDYLVVAESRLSMGAKDCTNGNEIYKSSIREKIKELLMIGNAEEKDIRAIIISGMLTSEFGLFNLPHISAPAGVKELHGSMKLMDVGISSIPCYFIPGVKIQSENVYEIDMLRGEECEFVGISAQMTPNSVCIMPGSHSKHIYSDEKKRIASFQSFLSGEMIYAFSKNTILSKSVDLSITNFDGEALLAGYDCVKKYGLNRALFQTRIMDKMLGQSAVALYSFFLGAILCEEVESLADCKKQIYICGQRSIRKAMIFLIKNRLFVSAVEIGDSDSEIASSRGAIEIFEYKGE